MPPQQDIVDLKLRALELKKAGDVDGAKALLAQARELEFQDVSADDLEDPSALKRLAVTLKKRGDLEGAKAALAKAKRLGADAGAGSGMEASTQQEQRQQQQPSSSLKEPAQATPPAAALPPAAANTRTNYSESSIRVNDQAGGEEEMDMSMDLEPVTFTDEEMLDLDMMTEFKLSGMDVPSDDDFQAKILACKKAAVRFKQSGDLERAKAALSRAKKFEAVMTKLAECGGPDDGIGDDDEAWLLEELKQEDSAIFEELFEDSQAFDLDDLDDMDAEMLKVMIDAGMEVPTPDEVMESSNEKKALALGLKQAGNLVGAKAALVESKRLQSRAERLKELLDAIAEGGDDDGDGGGIEDLERMLLSSEGSKMVKQQAKQEPATPSKSAEELKQEVIRLRTENNMKEATAVFKLYKEAQAAEAEAAEIERRKKLAAAIRDEIRIAEEQERLFLFYWRFVDGEVGALQLTKWREYAENCAVAARMMESTGSDAVEILRAEIGGTMLRIHNGDVDFVGGAADPSDERMEVAILSVLDVQENKSCKKILKEAKRQNADGSVDATAALSIRVDVTIQLPPNEKDTDDFINLLFNPSSSSSTESGKLSYQFGPSQYVHLPRGKSSYARMVHRRMSRKRIQISVFHVPAPAEKPSSWLRAWSSTAADEEKKPILLGKVTLQLNDFLTSNFVAGDFPLMDAGMKEVGGMVRLGVRMASPYDPQRGVGASLHEDDDSGTSAEAVDIRPFSAMSFHPATK